MTALATERNTVKYADRVIADFLEIPMKAATKVFQGSLVVSDAGYAAPARTALNLKAVGRAERTIDNTLGVAGAIRVKIRRGTFKWTNSAAGDLITQADLLATCYIVDDQTVAKTDGTGTRSIAGRIMMVDATGVWVETY